MHYHHVWWVVLHLTYVTRILFSPKKHFKLTSCSKLRILLRRELPHETRQPLSHISIAEFSDKHWPK